MKSDPNLEYVQQFGFRPAGMRINWSLILGAILAAIFIALAVFGPKFAPHHPLDENFIYVYDGGFVKSPFPPLTVPGYPLGSDEFGRDILSRLLWAVRPSLILVAVSAGIRLLIGFCIGLGAGWMNNRFSRMLESLISVSLSIPVIFVALFVIAALGQSWGLWAFILGLTLTGWAEPARMIKEQTRLIRTQRYIEASRAVGCTNGELIRNHVIHHIMPMVWMILAFETSAALLTSAALGFLGYFINAVWEPLGDFSSIRAAGLPDLGQMLAVSAGGIGKTPATMLSAGILIFLMILGFNLLGEGLRWQADETNRSHRKTRWQVWNEKIIDSLEERWYAQILRIKRALPVAIPIAAVFLLVIGGGYFLWNSTHLPESFSAISVYGEHQWASAMHDAQGTMFTDVSGPANPSVNQLAVFDQPLNTAPVVAADGTIYVGSEDQNLYALDADGNRKWVAALPDVPSQGPAIGPSGTVYIPLSAGGIAAIQPDGNLAWVLEGKEGETPVAGLIVSSDETIFFITTNYVQAVQADGTLRWRRSVPTYSYGRLFPRLTLDEKHFVFIDTLIRTNDGSTAFKETVDPTDVFIIGTDGKTYLFTTHEFQEFITKEEGGASLVPARSWNERVLGLGYRTPGIGGIAPNGNIYLYYASNYTGPKVFWLDAQGELISQNGYAFERINGSLASVPIGADGQGYFYLCGLMSMQIGEFTANCTAQAAKAGSGVAWTVNLPPGAFPIGGVILDGKLLVSSSDGVLYELADQPQ